MEEIILSTTGIIRRIDELGRIVIPKEIRKNLRIIIFLKVLSMGLLVFYMHLKKREILN